MAIDHESGSRIATPGFRWYVDSQAVSTIGSMMGYTALYWLTLQIAHGDAVVLSILVAAQFLPMLLFSRRAGNIVGRHRSAMVVITTQSLQAAGALALSIPLLAGWMSIWYLWVACFVIGCFQAVDVPARQVFMLDLVGKTELRRGSSLYAAITGLAKIVGPALAGVIIAFSGEAVVFATDAVSFLLVVGVLVWQMGTVGYTAQTERRDAVKARRLRWLLDLPRGIQVAAAMAVLMGGFGIQFEVTNPLMAQNVFHLDSRGFGLLGTLMAIGGITGNYYSSRRKDPKYVEFLAWALAFGARGICRSHHVIGMGIRRFDANNRRCHPIVCRQRDSLRTADRFRDAAGTRT